MNHPATKLLLFQAGWFACVAGGNHWALVAVALLGMRAVMEPLRLRDWSRILPVAALGLGIDLGWQALGLLRFSGAMAVSVPPWLAVLWLLFAVCLRDSMALLLHRPLLAAALAALAGPLSYVAGMRLGAATSEYPVYVVALCLAPAWAVLLPMCLRFMASAPAVARSAAPQRP